MCLLFFHTLRLLAITLTKKVFFSRKSVGYYTHKEGVFPYATTVGYLTKKVFFLKCVGYYTHKEGVFPNITCRDSYTDK